MIYFTMREILEILVNEVNSKTKFYSLPLFPTENILNFLSLIKLTFKQVSHSNVRQIFVF